MRAAFLKKVERLQAIHILVRFRQTVQHKVRDRFSVVWVVGNELKNKDKTPIASDGDLSAHLLDEQHADKVRLFARPNGYARVAFLEDLVDSVLIQDLSGRERVDIFNGRHDGLDRLFRQAEDGRNDRYFVFV